MLVYLTDSDLLILATQSLNRLRAKTVPSSTLVKEFLQQKTTPGLKDSLEHHQTQTLLKREIKGNGQGKGKMKKTRSKSKLKSQSCQW